MPDYLGRPGGIDGGVGLDVTVVGVAVDAGLAVGEPVGVPVTVCGGSGPDPSGSTTVVGTWPGVGVALVSVGLVSVVVVGVVVVGVVVVVVVVGRT
jgi:hypothetical protein